MSNLLEVAHVQFGGLSERGVRFRAVRSRRPTCCPCTEKSTIKDYCFKHNYRQCTRHPGGLCTQQFFPTRILPDSNSYSRFRIKILNVLLLQQQRSKMFEVDAAAFTLGRAFQLQQVRLPQPRTLLAKTQLINDWVGGARMGDGGGGPRPPPNLTNGKNETRTC